MEADEQPCFCLPPGQMIEAPYGERGGVAGVIISPCTGGGRPPAIVTLPLPPRLSSAFFFFFGQEVSRSAGGLIIF